MRVATELADDFVDGVAFVPLANVLDVNLLPRAVATNLGLAEASERSAPDAVSKYLRDRSFLLVLDNFEHLLAAAPIAVKWLADCPQLAILATSRSVLRVSGEHDVTVFPLGLPDLDRLSSPSDLLDVPAVQLLLERAQAAKSDFVPSANDLQTIAAICVGLDGLPLAIELAAARLKHLPLSSLLAKMERRMTLLTGGPRDQPDRLRTMRDAIAWSDSLLEPRAQSTFHRLGVFVGGFTLDAATSVIGAEHDVFDGIAELVDNSLLRQEVGAHDEPRYAMLETVREFAVERLAASGDEHSTRQAHAQYFVELAELADPNIWGGPEHKRWLDHLENEIANLRTGLAWLEAVGDNAGLLRLTAALGGLWHFRSFRVEGRDWLRRVLAQDPGTAPEARATALVKLAILNRELDGVSCPELVEEAIAIRRELGLEDVISWNLLLLSGLLDPEKDADKIVRVNAEAANMFECSQNEEGRAYLQRGEGFAVLERGEGDHAWDLFDASLAVIRRHATPFSLTVDLQELASLELEHGRIAEAASHYAECFDLWNETGSRECIVAAIAGTGRLALASGRPSIAARLLGASAALGDALGYVPRGAERSLIDRAVAETRASLGDLEFGKTWAVASKVPFEVARIEAEQALAATANDLARAPSKNVRVTDGLSPREREVLQFIAEGRSNREIAEHLSISVPTVKRHLTTIFAKLDLPSRAAAVAYAHTHGFA